MIVIGLTGSIGMGKSTTAAMFADLGVPVTSADEIVHRLYEGAAAPEIETAFPGTTANGRVDRDLLSKAVLNDIPALRRLESIVHPLVRAEQAAFVERARQDGRQLVLIDIPLLFETGAESRLDVVVVVTCDPAIQRARVLARPGMTPEKLEAILAQQMPDAAKRARADFVVDTGLGLEHARNEVDRIVATLMERVATTPPAKD